MAAVTSRDNQGEIETAHAQSPIIKLETVT